MLTLHATYPVNFTLLDLIAIIIVLYGACCKYRIHNFVIFSVLLKVHVQLFQKCNDHNLSRVEQQKIKLISFLVPKKYSIK